MLTWHVQVVGLRMLGIPRCLTYLLRKRSLSSCGDRYKPLRTHTRLHVLHHGRCRLLLACTTHVSYANLSPSCHQRHKLAPNKHGHGATHASGYGFSRACTGRRNCSSSSSAASRSNTGVFPASAGQQPAHARSTYAPGIARNTLECLV